MGTKLNETLLSRFYSRLVLLLIGDSKKQKNMKFNSFPHRNDP